MPDNFVPNLKLQEVISAVREFHDAFRIRNENEPTVAVDDKTVLLRYKLMREENEEYLEAAQNEDLVEVADALGDMLYILCGTILSHGMQHKIEEVFQEIQRSNMSKLDANGDPIYREDGKVLKSELYFKPDIKSILDKN
ncbi:MAG: nucleoside triphosphate pyrophosphohydrolase family protein [Salibacteraceae bacterium]